MDLHLLRVFQREVARQCTFAIMAAEDTQRSLQSYESDRLWYSVQALLVAVANVSKLLWSSGASRSTQCRALRCSLSVQDSSPLKPRRLRNHLEHFGERLAAWHNVSRAKAVIDGNVGPLDHITGVAATDCLRNFDPATWTITFQGESYRLKPIIAAVRALWRIAAAESAKPSVGVDVRSGGG